MAVLALVKVQDVTAGKSGHFAGASAIQPLAEQGGSFQPAHFEIGFRLPVTAQLKGRPASRLTIFFNTRRYSSGIIVLVPAMSSHPR